MRTFNGVVMFKHVGVHHNIYVDASLACLGGVWGSHVYSVPILFEIIGETSINQYEMYNILLALRLWGPELRDKTVHVHCGFVCLFGVLRRFQHCTGHITTGSWKGRGNQYI